MNILWILVLMLMPTTAVGDARERYIARLLKSGWSMKQLQESGLSVEGSTSPVLPTHGMSTLYSVMNTESTTPEYSSSVASPEYPELKTFSVSSDFGISDTTYEYSSIRTTTEYGIAFEYTEQVGFNSVRDLLTSTEQIIIETSVELSSTPLVIPDMVVPTFESLDEDTLVVSKINDSLPVYKDYVSGQLEIFHSTVNDSQQFVSSDINSAEIIRNFTPERSIVIESNNSGLFRLIHGWLSNLDYKVNGSLMLPGTDVWNAGETMRVPSGSEKMSERGEVSDSVTWADLPLQGGPLLLTLLAVVAFILSKYSQTV